MNWTNLYPKERDSWKISAMDIQNFRDICGKKKELKQKQKISGQIFPFGQFVRGLIIDLGTKKNTKEWKSNKVNTTIYIYVPRPTPRPLTLYIFCITISYTTHLNVNQESVNLPRTRTTAYTSVSCPITNNQEFFIVKHPITQRTFLQPIRPFLLQQTSPTTWRLPIGPIPWKNIGVTTCRCGDNVSNHGTITTKWNRFGTGLSRGTFFGGIVSSTFQWIVWFGNGVVSC